MLYLVAGIVAFALVVALLHLLPFIVSGALEWDDVRSILLHHAYRSFTFEGDVIPGVRPSRGTRLVIRVLSHEDEARRALVGKAMAATERPRKEAARPVNGAAMSRAVVHARWFAAPPRAAWVRAR